MRQSASLRVESLSRGRVCYLRLYGTVDETFDQNELFEAIEGRDAILNLKAVKRFTSFGVREWVHFIEALKQRVDRLVFVECSLAFVGQLNVVGNFAGNAQVVSVQVPYFCSDCEWDTEKICELKDSQPPDLSTEVVCRRCGAKMAFDDDKESYFSFLDGVKVAKLDPELREFLQTFTDSQPEIIVASAETAPSGPSMTMRLKAFMAVAATHGRAALNYGRRLARVGGRRGKEIWHEMSKLQQGMSKLQQGIAAGCLGLVILVIAILAVPSSSDPVEEHSPVQEISVAERASTLIAGGELDEAESLIATLDGNEEMFEQQTALSERLGKVRQRIIDEEVGSILDSWRAKDYGQVVEKWAARRTLHEQGYEICFAVAESYRLIEKHEDARTYYGYLTENWSDSPRFDDALFWVAEQQREAGEVELARANYRAIIRIRSSNFRKSARKRLKLLPRAKKR